jgi:hypothetical protein
VLSGDAEMVMYQFVFCETPPRLFGNWLCAHLELEDVIGTDEYVGLLSIDYKNAAEVVLAREKTSTIYNKLFQAPLAYERVKRTLEKMIVNELSLLAGCRELARLRDVGYLSIPLVFRGYESEIERVGLEFYEGRIRIDVDQLLIAIKKTDKSLWSNLDKLF